MQGDAGSGASSRDVVQPGLFAPVQNAVKA